MINIKHFIIREFADVIILNKIDIVEAKELAQVESLLRQLNPDAKIYKTKFGNISLKSKEV
jgi:G3E family GTPase